MSYTPGPWKVIDDSFEHEPIVYRGGIGMVVHDSNHDRRLADARLISAAPELLAAVERVVSDCRYGDPKDGYAEIDWESIVLCRAAIAKAKGQA